MNFFFFRFSCFPIKYFSEEDRQGQGEVEGCLLLVTKNTKEGLSSMFYIGRVDGKVGLVWFYHPLTNVIGHEPKKR